jgi:type I restriction enzyme S subunit
MAGDVSTALGNQGWLYHPDYPDDWERSPLYSVAQWVNGLAFRDIQFSPSGMPVIKIAEIKGGISGQTKFTEQTFDESVRVRPGDLLFSWSGQPETSIDAFWWRGPEGWLNQHVFRVTPADGIDPTFFYYLLRYLKPNFVGIARNKQTTGLGHVTKRDLENIEAAYPELPEQRAIAHILGTLDDKIELNRRMSETLEAMARALFKSWFVDFDPVRAKAEGRDPRLPQPLADLFPDSFEDSELGEIPRGWGGARLGDVLGELVSGGRPKGGAAAEGVPSIGAENVIGLGKYDFSKEKYVPREFFKELQRKGSAVRPGDVLLYKDGAQIGRKTYFDCEFPHAECAVNEHVFIVRGRRKCHQRYLFFWLDQDWMTQEIISLNSNSAQPGINQQGVRSLPFLMAPDPVVEAFDHISKLLTDRLFAACLESRTLAALRDALLPKLISGELRVRDAERMVARADA